MNCEAVFIHAYGLLSFFVPPFLFCVLCDLMFIFHLFVLFFSSCMRARVIMNILYYQSLPPFFRSHRVSVCMCA